MRTSVELRTLTKYESSMDYVCDLCKEGLITLFSGLRDGINKKLLTFIAD